MDCLRAQARPPRPCLRPRRRVCLPGAELAQTHRPPIPSPLARSLPLQRAPETMRRVRPHLCLPPPSPCASAAAASSRFPGAAGEHGSRPVYESAGRALRAGRRARERSARAGVLAHLAPATAAPHRQAHRRGWPAERRAHRASAPGAPAAETQAIRPAPRRAPRPCTRQPRARASRGASTPRAARTRPAAVPYRYAFGSHAEAAGYRAPQRATRSGTHFR